MACLSFIKHHMMEQKSPFSSFQLNGYSRNFEITNLTKATISIINDRFNSFDLISFPVNETLSIGFRMTYT